MSLLNNMLNDLEKRQATAGVDTSRLEAHHLLSPLQRKGSGMMILLGLTVVAAGVVGYFWFTQQKMVAPPPLIHVAANNLPKAHLVSVAPVSGNENVATPPQNVLVNETAVTSAISSPLERVESEAAVNTSAANLVAQQTKETQDEAIVLTKKPAKAIKVSRRDKSAEGASFKVVRPQQQSDNLYWKALSLLQQLKQVEAQQTLQEALSLNALNHSARQLLAELLLESGDQNEAESLLKKGLDLSPEQSSFSITLARLQATNGAGEDAISTLERGLPTAGDDPDYCAFLAALLQKKGRHSEAIGHYVTALRSNPTMPNWLIGIGISLQAENKLAEAEEAFQRAIDTGELSPEVERFANNQLKLIRQRHSATGQ